MICVECAKGGDANGVGAYQAADYQHSRCEYPVSCPCLHRIGNQWHG